MNGMGYTTHKEKYKNKKNKDFAFKGFQTFLNFKKCMKNDVKFSTLTIGIQFQSLYRAFPELLEKQARL